jgi:hypothetical protein
MTGFKGPDVGAGAQTFLRRLLLLYIREKLLRWHLQEKAVLAFRLWRCVSEFLEDWGENLLEA